MFVIAVGSKFWCVLKYANGEQSKAVLAVPGQYGLQALGFETGSAAAQWARQKMDDPDGVKFRVLEKLDNAQVTEFHPEAPQPAKKIMGFPAVETDMDTALPEHIEAKDWSDWAGKQPEAKPKVHRKKRKVSKTRRKANG